MTKEQFLLLYKAFVLLGKTESQTMTDSTCRIVRRANDMIWDVLSGCKNEKSIAEYAAEIGITEDDLKPVREGL